jgi:dipeptidyl aminopeptidase/acylaminoacyl peptidase
MLPNESHGYTAKESIMHMLWEQDEWLEAYVKNRTD